MKPIFAMAHPMALPGSFRHNGENINEIADRLLKEVAIYHDGGFTGVIIQNINDFPLKQDLYPEKIAYMTYLGSLVRREFPDLKLGIMLNWNAVSALAVADAVSADFVRIEHTFVGAEVFCTGMFEGQCVDAMELKKKIGSRVKVFADVYDPYGSAIGKKSIEEACFDAVSFCFADGLFLEGKSPEESIQMVTAARKTVETPIYLGGGSNADTVPLLYPHFDAMCVGKWLKKDGYILNPIDMDRLHRYMNAIHTAAANA